MSAGPAAIFGLDRPRIAVGAHANLTLVDLERNLAGEAVRLPLALDQLLAARPASARSRQADDRGRTGGVSAVNAAALILEDGTVFDGQSVGAEGFAFGEAVFTTSMSGYQEVGDRPELRGPDRLLHRPDGRELRRRRGAQRIEARARESGRDARRTRSRVDRLAARARSGGDDGRRHPFARSAPARSRRDARGRCHGRDVGRRGPRRGSRAAGDGRRRARLGRVGARALHIRRRGTGAGGRGRLRLQALDPPPAGSERRRRRRVPARRRRRHAGGATTACCSRRGRAIPSR